MEQNPMQTAACTSDIRGEQSKTLTS